MLRHFHCQIKATTEIFRSTIPEDDMTSHLHEIVKLGQKNPLFALPSKEPKKMDKGKIQNNI